MNSSDAGSQDRGSPDASSQNTGIQNAGSQNTSTATADPASHSTPNSSSQPVLRFSEVSKTFPDGTHTLDKVSFSVSKGEFFALVGPSGCGKSTLLRIASGLDTATEGTVLVDKEHLGYIFQDATLMPWRNVQRNVELLGELHNIPKAKRRQLAQEAIQTVGLDKFTKHYPAALSGGMKMRVSIARTLTLNPAVFMFDEPFGALDEITRERLGEETLRLFVEEQFAGLFVTHSITEAVFLSTHVGVMSHRPGRILDIFEIPFPHPRNPDIRFEAEFAELCGKISASLRSSNDESQVPN